MHIKYDNIWKTLLKGLPETNNLVSLSSSFTKMQTVGIQCAITEINASGWLVVPACNVHLLIH